MPARLTHHLAIAAAALSVLAAAHLADRIAFGLQMQARGLAPAQPLAVLP